MLWQFYEPCFLVSHYFYHSTDQTDHWRGSTDCQHLVYGIHKTIAHTKLHRCILSRAVMEMNVSLYIVCACTCKGPYFLFRRIGWISLFLSSWQPVCHPLHNQELTFSSITTIILPFFPCPLPSPLQFYCLSPPYIFLNCTSFHFSFTFCQAFVIDRWCDWLPPYTVMTCTGNQPAAPFGPLVDWTVRWQRLMTGQKHKLTPAMCHPALYNQLYVTSQHLPVQAGIQIQY